MAKLYFKFGAVGASKTANALMVRYNYLERGKVPVMLKPRMECRDGEHTIRSRIGLEAECAFVEDFLESMKHHQGDEVDFDVVIVDEAQFLTTQQIDELAAIVDNYDVSVICYGLRTDFQGEGFEGATRLLLIADKIENIKTVCWCGRAACFNARIDNQGNIIRAGDKIVFGGTGTYISLCRKHYYQGITSGNAMNTDESLSLVEE
ncbi:thymidine kinase [Bifidobacterium dolichotidis]|uniref:Thymidine kinase n=1 Tax=Bifidobacterium dolichotidis TaxID=2306976 RepID=A0A430FTH1_9BIFI|nr:thymidine kinase [Bifidobacterium dolichotidis]RSX56161.1 thymidine kinase [Bifidobacterium dolichotidis]